MGEHLSALRFNSRKLFVRSCCCQSRHISFTARHSLIICQRQNEKREEEDRSMWENWLSARFEKKKKTPHEQSVRWAFALLCLFIPYGQTWTPYTRCWSRQARSVETRQTHHLRLPQQNTPLPVQHLRQRGLPPIPVPRPPLVRRTTKNSYRPWNVRRNPKNFATCSGGLRARHSSGSQDARKLESHVSEFRRWTLYRY